MVILALLLNIDVLLPVCLGLVTNASWARESYSELTPARGILLSVYMAIAFASVGLLFYRAAKLVYVLLLVQVVYKLTTPFTVGTLQNPVVVSNLGIAASSAPSNPAPAASKNSSRQSEWPPIPGCAQKNNSVRSEVA